ncbi:MAG: 30S ribosomal protein S16 [Candidatus Blackburnbacteria bacterium]|nr:30S ribosomal protein S16 [Candidatus Blackburnbacteria bacterium]
MLAIRLMQTGKKHDRHYRIVVAEKRSKRDGKMVAQVGYWSPREKKLSVDQKKYQLWITKGAQPTQTVRKLIRLI